MKRKLYKEDFYRGINQLEEELIASIPISRKKKLVVASVDINTTVKYFLINIPKTLDLDGNWVRDIDLPIKVKEVEKQDNWDYAVVDSTVKSYRTASTKKEYIKIIKEIFYWPWEVEKYLKNNPW